MYSYSRSQQSHLYTTPTSSKEQIQSFDPLHHQNQDGSSLTFKNFLTPSVLSLTYHDSNPTDSENTNGGSPTKDQISIIHGLKWLRFPDINISKVFEIENLIFAENQLIQNFKHWNTNMTHKLSVCTLRLMVEPLKHEFLKRPDGNSQVMSTNHENSKFNLLNPIFLLARLRTPQYAFQLSTQKNRSNLAENNGYNEEFGLKARGITAYDANILEQVEIDSVFPDPGSCCESSSSTWSPDSLHTDESSLTSISEYASNPIFLKDIGRNKMLQFDESSEQVRSEMMLDPIQILENASINKEIFECEDAERSASYPEYIYPNETKKISDENIQGKNITHFNSITCFNQQSFYQLLSLSPTKYHLTPYNFKTNCPLTTLVSNSNFDESNFNANNNQSLTKYLSLYDLIIHHANLLDQLSNNLISKKRIEPNLLQSFNYEDPTLRILNHEDSNLENMQKINELTEDSLAAHQRALESAACNINTNVGLFLENIVSEEYLQLKQEISQPSLSNDSYEASSQEAISLSDEFEDDFNFDEDSQDCAFIEAVNAEALANDFDGFYGQEFGLYPTPDVTGRNYSHKIGGYSRNSCAHSSRNRRFLSREPLLSPITECSEFSFCNPYEAPVIHTSNPIEEITTPRLEQFPSGRLKKDFQDINNLDYLLKSRQDLWSENHNSVQSFSNCSHWSSDSEE